RVVRALRPIAAEARAATALGRCSPASRRFATSATRLLALSPPPRAKLTAEAYPSLKRDERFAPPTEEHAAYFKEVLGSAGSAVIDGVTADAEADLEPFNEDWMHKYKGQCRLVLKPGSTEEVSKILRYCNEKKLAVVPQGGNTGLVGGSVPVF